MKKILLTSCVLFLVGASAFAQNQAATKQAPKAKTLKKVVTVDRSELTGSLGPNQATLEVDPTANKVLLRQAATAKAKLEAAQKAEKN